ncbi:Uncharacterized protein GBIM_16399 [Gryllus bimaculatus]|nr:Uncharacterized protein GBIM_16399 [Gryllus bimaculatus]
MVAIMDPNLDPSSMYHFVAVDREGSLWKTGQSCADSSDDTNSVQRETVMVRSVAMSANVASIVKDEVRHLIRVSALEPSTSKHYSTYEPNNREDINIVLPTSKDLGVGSNSIVNTSCSHILPTVDGNIIFAVILSRWDDIMGPQTVHAWLEENPVARGLLNTEVNSPSSSYVDTLPESKSGVHVTSNHKLVEQNVYIMKAVKYVTSHTVNYTGICLNSSASLLYEQESNLFVVPDLELVAQSLVFHARSLDTTVPFSLSVLVGYQHYEYFLHLRRLCHQWLRRMAERLHEPLVKCMSTSTGFTSISVTRLNNWVLEFWHTIFSLGKCGLGNSLLACGADMLNHPLLERALTSHLQTFGCTVIMGTSSSDINALISFLALFLDSDEKFCSRLVLPTMKYSYHVGLFVQGLLLDEFGCRELCSVDLAASPYLVTAVDLTKGVNANAVRQTSPQNLNRSGDGFGKTQLHRSILYPVKESASLIKSLLKDMQHIPPSSWQHFIGIFKKKINSLAYMLLSFMHQSVMEYRGGSLQLERYLMKNMNLLESDFLIVLAAAEKLKPGIYDHVMDHDAVFR